MKQPRKRNKRADLKKISLSNMGLLAYAVLKDQKRNISREVNNFLTMLAFYKNGPPQEQIHFLARYKKILTTSEAEEHAQTNSRYAAMHNRVDIEMAALNKEIARREARDAMEAKPIAEVDQVNKPNNPN